MLSRRAAIAGGFVATVAAGVLLYSYMRGREYVFRFSEADLRASLVERLPFTRTYLLAIEVTLDEPRIVLEEGSDRVTAGIDVIVGMPAIGAAELRGSVDAISGLRYEPDAGSFYLVEPEIRRLSVQGVPDRYSARVNDAVTQALRAYYRERPIYRLRSGDIRQAAARLVLKNVTVVDRELVVTLGL